MEDRLTANPVSSSVEESGDPRGAHKEMIAQAAEQEAVRCLLDHSRDDLT